MNKTAMTSSIRTTLCMLAMLCLSVPFAAHASTAAEIDAKVEKALAALPNLPDVPDAQPVPGNGERRVIVRVRVGRRRIACRE